MPHVLGAEVRVTRLQKDGRVAEVGPHGRYRVVVGGMSVWCGDADLKSVTPRRQTGKRRREPQGPGGTVASRAPPLAASADLREHGALGKLDLHGLTVPEALHAVDVRIDRAIRAGLDRLEIIHGSSGGRLRAAVRRHLEGMPNTRAVVDRQNAGVTWACFED